MPKKVRRSLKKVRRKTLNKKAVKRRAPAPAPAQTQVPAPTTTGSTEQTRPATG